MDPSSTSPIAVVTAVVAVIATAIIAILLLCLWHDLALNSHCSEEKSVNRRTAGIGVIDRHLQLRKDRPLPMCLTDESVANTDTQLQHDTTTLTCTSMTENVGSCTPEDAKESVDVIDVPGYGKVRGAYKKYIDTTKRIIFLVSAAEVKKTIKDDASYLHDIIVNNKNQVPMLIVCNKSDVNMSESEDVVRMMLEKELNKLRRRVAKPGEVVSDEDLIMYGSTDEDFKFDQLEYPVMFTQASVKQNDIDGVWKFISEIVPKKE